MSLNVRKFSDSARYGSSNTMDCTPPFRIGTLFAKSIQNNIQFRHGKIAEEWSVFDQYTMLRQLELLK